MKKLSVIILIAVIVIFAACAKVQTDKPSQELLKAVEISLVIETDPDNALSALKEHSMSVDAYKDLMIKISEDDKLSEQYIALKEKQDI
ncbi:hypothetical protein KAI78_09585 [bacterium]|nr:hypothetical protein [bacterium]MCK5599862.1 hypothetical protein [bacterium]